MIRPDRSIARRPVIHRLAEGGLGAQRVLGGLAPGDVVRHRVYQALLAHRVDAPHQPLVAAIGAAAARLEAHRLSAGEPAQHA